jgi:hypothetical protein
VHLTSGPNPKLDLSVNRADFKNTGGEKPFFAEEPDDCGFERRV